MEVVLLLTETVFPSFFLSSTMRMAASVSLGKVLRAPDSLKNGPNRGISLGAETVE